MSGDHTAHLGWPYIVFYSPSKHIQGWLKTITVRGDGILSHFYTFSFLVLLKLFFGLTLFDVMDAMTGATPHYGGTGYGAPATGYGAPAQSYGAPSTGYAAPSSGYSSRSSYDEDDVGSNGIRTLLTKNDLSLRSNWHQNKKLSTQNWPSCKNNWTNSRSQKWIFDTRFSTTATTTWPAMPWVTSATATNLTLRLLLPSHCQYWPGF